MTDKENASLMDVVYLLSCAACGISPDADRISAMDLTSVLAISRAHMVSAMAAMALKSAGIQNAGFEAELSQAQQKALLLSAHWDALARQLDQAGIWFMPLKGAVLKDYYPKYWLREMSDYDILVDSARISDVRPLMEGLGFTAVEIGKGSHDVYEKLPISVFEIHRDLFEARFGPKKYAYYQDVKSRLLRDPNHACGWRFSPEDFYVYMTAHANKHYVGSGTGLRSFLDVYIYLKHFGDQLDIPYIEGEMEKLGMAEFERDSRALAQALFDGQPLTEKQRAMLDFIYTSGALGSADHLVDKKIQKYGGSLGGKIRFLFSRIFLPMEAVQSMYPFFYHHKILLPSLPFYRGWLALTSRRRNTLAELRALLRHRDRK